MEENIKTRKFNPLESGIEYVHNTHLMSLKVPQWGGPLDETAKDRGPYFINVKRQISPAV